MPSPGHAWRTWGSTGTGHRVPQEPETGFHRNRTQFFFRKRENQSLSGKPILIGKTNPHRENQSLSGKPILIGKTNPLKQTNKQHATS